MTYYTRRLLLRALTGSVCWLALPRVALATWPRAAFSANSTEHALQALFDCTNALSGRQVELIIPESAQSGAMIPVTVQTTLHDVTAIGLFVDANPSPLAAAFELGLTTQPVISTRIKMTDSSVVRAVVLAKGELYSAEQHVSVKLGSCAG